MEDFNIPKNTITSTNEQLKIPSGADVYPKVNLPKQNIIDPTAIVKRSSPELIIRNFGLQFLETEIYKGRIAINAPDQPTIERKSILGTNLFSDLQFTSVDGVDHVPIDCALFNVRQSKNVVRNDIQGRDGSIKTYIGLGDYEITVRGIIMGQGNQYPWDAVINFVYFLRYEQSLGIISQYLNDVFDVTEVVIKEYYFEQNEGSQSHQKFELTMWSDKPVGVLIQEAV